MTQLISSCTKSNQFKPNNMVIIVWWKNEISLHEAFHCLPIVVIDDHPTKNKKSDKLKIPYYGTEDIIVSIRHKRGARGLRSLTKQQDNFVSVDLQTSNKNVHIKLSKNNAEVMGVTSLEQGLDSVQCLLDLIHQTDDNLEFLRNSLSDDVILCEEFIEALFTKYEKGKNIPDYNEIMNLIDDHNNSIDKEIDNNSLNISEEINILNINIKK